MYIFTAVYILQRRCSFGIPSGQLCSVIRASAHTMMKAEQQINPSTILEMLIVQMWILHELYKQTYYILIEQKRLQLKIKMSTSSYMQLARCSAGPQQQKYI